MTFVNLIFQHSIETTYMHGEITRLVIHGNTRILLLDLLYSEQF